MKKLMIVAGCWLMGIVGVAWAGDPWLKPLAVQEQGYRGATHCVEITPAELTEDTANVAQTNTITLTGPMAWAFAGFEVSQPFDSTLVTNAHSIATTVTLGSVTLVDAVETAADAWRPYKAIFPVENTLTNVYAGVITNGATETLTLITGAPGASCYLSKVNSGQERLFLKIWK